MSRIREAFINHKVSEATEDHKQKVFIGFLTAGDPNLKKTEEFIVKMQKAGAALVEIGIPFSDPIAEGTVIQEANVRALSGQGGCTMDMVFDMVKSVRKSVGIPLVFLTYLNPVFKYGYEAFCERCSEVGVDGVIIPDMPFEERGELEPIARRSGVDVITMIAPTSQERVAMLSKEATGYIYLVSSMGVTGVRNEITTDITHMVKAIRQVTNTPIAIGFGINTPKQAREYSGLADGVIVGSAIVKLIAEHGENAGEYIYQYVKTMVDNM